MSVCKGVDYDLLNGLTAKTVPVYYVRFLVSFRLFNILIIIFINLLGFLSVPF